MNGRADPHRRAEKRIPAAPAAITGASHEADITRLLHELEVHRIELEQQNEELRAARTEMEAGLSRYTELFDFAPIGYITLGKGGEIREVNHEASAVLKQHRRLLVGLPLVGFVAATDRAMVTSLLARVQAGEDGATCEVRLNEREQFSKFVRLSARMLAGAEQKILIAFQDISESRAREEQLARTERALREVNRRKDEFLATLSHELRNPLAPIRNSLFVLSHAPPGSPQALQGRTVIDRQVTHLTRLIDDLLDVTRITRGKIELRRERIELGDLIRRAIEDHRANFERSGITLDHETPNGRCWVQADPARLVQVLSNLLTNAEKFTPRGGRVVVSLTHEKTQFALRIRDTGAGVPAELIPHLFEAFVQGPQTIDRTRGGLGLGLAMVKGLIELHGGTVSLASQGPGKGTEITIRLPAESEPEPVPIAASLPSVSHRRVLIIEDNPDAAESLRDALELNGHDVHVAYDGPEGIELAHKFHPEFVICDIGLPRMDGYAVARAMRSDEALQGTYLIALSGYAQPEDREHAARAGFHQHVAKPPSVEALERLLASVPTSTKPQSLG